MLDDFISCNRKVYYRLNKPEQAVQNKEMVMGEIVHSAIEKYWNNEIFSQGYLYGEMKKRLPDESMAFASTALENYHKHFQRFLADDDKVEMRFKIPWEKDVFIVGKIDRISSGNVFDWKTARKPLTNVSKSIQFILYNWAYKKTYNSEPSGVYYVALTTGEMVKYYKDGVSDATLFDEVIPQAIRVIRSKEYLRNGIFRHQCFRCPYSKICLEE